MSHERAKAFQWAQLILGAVLFAGMIAVHAWVKELDIMLFSIPGALLGANIIKKGK